MRFRVFSKFFGLCDEEGLLLCFHIKDILTKSSRIGREFNLNVFEYVCQKYALIIMLTVSMHTWLPFRFREDKSNCPSLFKE